MLKHKPGYYALGTLRIAIGWLLVWAFFDKLFGLGFATVSGKAWIDGTSPTFGFLKFASRGPLASLHQAIAGNAVVDVLFMAGLIGIGAALILGIALKLATIAGITLFLLMYSALLPPENNPFVDEHVLYILVLVALYSFRAGSMLGFGERWSRSFIVKKFPLLGN